MYKNRHHKHILIPSLTDTHHHHHQSTHPTRYPIYSDINAKTTCRVAVWIRNNARLLYETVYIEPARVRRSV